jgi:hypothetical protein
MTSWDAIRNVMLGYPHARACGDDEVQIAFTHVDVGVGVRVLHRASAVMLIAEIGELGAFDPLVALRFNTLAVQRIGVIADRYILRDEMTSSDPDAIARQVTAFVRTAAALRRRRRRRELTAFAFAV